MELFSSNIKILITKQGGINKSNKLALDWYKNGYRDNVDESVAYWPKQFEPGKIYTFRYDPLLKDSLDFYDKNPVVFSLGTITTNRGLLDLALNLNFMPFKAKLLFFDLITKRFGSILERETVLNPTDAVSQRMLPVNYRIAKLITEKFGCMFALRSYYASRRKKCAVMSYDNWDKAVTLNVFDLEGITIQNVYRKYYANAKKLNKVSK